MDKKTILIYIDVMERYYFFRKFFKPLKELGYEPIVLTARLSIYFRVKKENIKVYLLKESGVDNKTTFHPNVQNSLSVVAKYHTAIESQKLYKIVFLYLKQIYKMDKFEAFFIWNGTTTFAKALGDFAIKHGVKRYYFEISNLGKKVFVDKEGVNANSFLAKCPKILDKISYKKELYHEWKRDWKKGYTLPKQMRNKTKIPYSFFIDWFGFTFFRLLREDRRLLFDVLKSKYMLKKIVVKADDISKLPNNYLFFVMQVSNDSQILLNSDIDNLEGLKIAKEMARELDMPLVVKLHPAEIDIEFIKEIEKRSLDGAFILTDASTYKLLEQAYKVVVINSTVGVEAMILQKDVVVLGRAYYKEFTDDRLGAFVLGYLIDIDYFDRQESISISTVKRVLEQYDKNCSHYVSL